MYYSALAAHNIIGDEMSNNEKMDGVPLGFGMTLAENPYALARFAAMTEEEKRAVIGKARTVSSKQEMRALLDSCVGMQEPKGPVQL